MFSIVVLTFNHTFKQIEITLKSILCQKCKFDFEIIISDDGSETTFNEEIRCLFKKAEFTEYKLFFHENYGTVDNLLSAVKVCRYKYIKPFGAGDLFVRNDVLQKVYNIFESEGYQACFGKLSVYEYDNLEEVNVLGSFNHPNSLRPYKKKNQSRIKRNNLIFDDYICGASLFYESRYLLEYIKRISGWVTFCEDLIQQLYLLDDLRIGYIDQCLVWYEYGVGVSTNVDIAKKVKKTGKNEHAEFMGLLNQNYGNNNYIIRKRKLIKLREGKFRGKVTSYLFFPYLLYRKISKHKNIVKCDENQYKGFLENKDFQFDFKKS